MRLLIVLLLSLTIASADQYYGGGAAPAPQVKPAPAPLPPTPATCGLPAKLDDDCTAFAQRSCSGGVTTTFQICRNVVSKFCSAPRAFADVATCVQTACGSLNGDASHPTATVRAVCSGTYNTAQISAGEKQYFPTGIPAQIDGVTVACAKLVCQTPPPPPPVETTEEVLAEPLVPAEPKLVAAYQAQQAQPAPAAVPTCALPATLADDCTKFAQDACSGGVTATFAICRRVAVDLCQKPKSFADVETCVQNHCGSLEGDAGHPTETVRQVCGGTYDTKNIAPSFRQYFPAGIPDHIDGVRGACARLVCAAPAPVPAPVTTEEVNKEPFVEPAPGLMDAYNKQQQEKQAPPAPVPTPVVVPAPQPPAPAPTPVVVPAPAPVPAPVPTPVVVPPTTPVVTTPVTQDCSVIMVDADEEDCTAALRQEVEQLEKYVDQLTILLASKGAKFTEACVVTTGGGGDKPGDKPNGNGGNGGDKPGDKPNGNGGNGGDKPGDKPEDNGKGGDKPGDKPNGNGGNGGDKPGDKPQDNGKGGDKPGDKPTTQGGNGGGDNKTPTNNGGAGNGNGNKPQQNAQAGVQTKAHSSSAGVSAALVVGLVVGSAVCAGIVAVAIGFFVAAPAAGGAAVVSAAPMACAATNPLYVPLTSGGTNLLA